jgi:hypothetical protein
MTPYSALILRSYLFFLAGKADTDGSDFSSTNSPGFFQDLPKRRKQIVQPIG